MSAERRLSSSDGQYEERERSEHLSTHDMSNADAGEGTNDTRPGTSSTSNIDEIINAVASNQLGSPARKPMKVVSLLHLSVCGVRVRGSALVVCL